MKNIFIKATCCICFLLAGKSSSAQNNSDEQKLVVVPVKLTTAKQPEPKKPEAAASQNTTAATAQTTAATAPQAADFSKDAKGVEIKPNAQQGLKPQNIDRPKASTLQPDKKINTPAIAAPQPAPLNQ